MDSVASTSALHGPRLFLFVVTAERIGDETRPGRRTVLVFSRGDHPDAAMSSAEQEIHALGWRRVELEGAKELVGDPADEKDEVARTAMQLALTRGFAHLVY